MGGDEFAIVLKNCPEELALKKYRHKNARGDAR